MYAILVSFLRKDLKRQTLSNHFQRLNEMHDKTARSRAGFRLILIVQTLYIIL